MCPTKTRGAKTRQRQTGAYTETRSRRANANPNTGNLWVQKEQARDRVQKNKQVGNERIRETEVLESHKAVFTRDLAENEWTIAAICADVVIGSVVGKVSRRGGGGGVRWLQWWENRMEEAAVWNDYGEYEKNASDQ